MQGGHSCAPCVDHRLIGSSRGGGSDSVTHRTVGDLKILRFAERRLSPTATPTAVSALPSLRARRLSVDLRPSRSSAPVHAALFV